MDNTRTIVIAVVVILVIAVGAFMFIQANSHNTKIDVISNSTLKNGDFIELVLTDEYRNVYPGEKVYVKILDDSGWGNTQEVTTDDNGKAAVEILGLDNGEYSVHCNYNGTLFNKECRSVTTLIVDDGYGF